MAEERTAIVRVDPVENSAYVALKAEVESFVSSAEKAEIATVEDREFATNDLSMLAKLKKSIADLRIEYLTPLKEYTDTINNAFKELTDPLSKADGIMRQKVLVFNQEQERIRREAEDLARQEKEIAERRARLNGEASKYVPEPMPAIADQREVTDLGESNTRKVRKWEVEDFSKVPDECKVINSGYVTKLVKAGIVSIPGIKIWEEKTLVVEAVNV